MEQTVELPMKVVRPELWPRIKSWLTPLIVPLLLLVGWHVGVKLSGTQLIPATERCRPDVV